jgi:hypothetical protein
VRLDVRTTYRGFSADMMRDELGNGERAQLQHRYLNFYAGSYAGIRVAAPFEVSDDTRANTVVVTEHYAVKDFWPADGQGARQAALRVPEMDNELRAPAEPLRTMPLSLHGPQSLHEQLRVQLPQDWPERRFDRTVANDAFRLSKSLRIRDRVLTADYALEIGKDQVDAPAVARLVDDIGKAQDLLGDSLSTARSGAAPWGRAVAVAACVLALGAAALAWRRGRGRANGGASRGASAAAPDLGPETAANDSEQPLAA